MYGPIHQAIARLRYPRLEVTGDGPIAVITADSITLVASPETAQRVAEQGGRIERMDRLRD